MFSLVASRKRHVVVSVGARHAFHKDFIIDLQVSTEWSGVEDRVEVLWRTEWREGGVS